MKRAHKVGYHVLQSILWTSLAILTGCTSIRGWLPAPGPPQGTGMLQSGAARVDLTPPPGFPMGGHSLAGKVARGFWSRLHARAIYIQDSNGHSVALVACDLWSLPAGLADRVAELVAADPAATNLSRNQILLAATHTHQSPGNFSSCELYNQFASPEPGFDPDLFEFLATRIARAISESVRAQQPARLFYGETTLGLVARNRSFPAFVRDPECETILKENVALPLGKRLAEYPTVEAHLAVDPVLKVLRIETIDEPSKIIAMAGFFTVHATAMSHTTEFYTSDLFGVATTLVEQKLSATGDSAVGRPVVALFNGPEGDISPAWTNQDRFNTIVIGSRLAGGISSLMAGGMRLDGSIAYRFTNAPLANVAFTDFDGHSLHTADQPLPGAPMLGGAEDGRTPYFERGYIEGLTGPPTPDHGVKLGALDLQYVVRQYLGLGPIRLTQALVPKRSVPRQVPVGLYQIGDAPGVTLATLPGEFTLVMGRRIASMIGTNLSHRNPKVLLVGLANEYVSYFSTPEEYNAQHYEGASTLYGPNAGTLVGYQIGYLARQLERAKSEIVARKFIYWPGGTKRFGVSRLAGQSSNVVERAVEQVVMGAQARQFDWEDLTPRLDIPHASATNMVVPLVRIEVQRGTRWEKAYINGIEETNEGLDFVTLVTVPGRRKSTWRAVWMPPNGMDSAALYRFCVEKLSGQTSCSDPFRM